MCEIVVFPFVFATKQVAKLILHHYTKKNGKNLLILENSANINDY